MRYASLPPGDYDVGFSMHGLVYTVTVDRVHRGRLRRIKLQNIAN